MCLKRYLRAPNGIKLLHEATEEPGWVQMKLEASSDDQKVSSTLFEGVTLHALSVIITITCY